MNEIYAWSANDYRNYLCHYGILGMKWGIRRFQNPDGSLTPEGKERYGKLSEQRDEYSRKLDKELLLYSQARSMEPGATLVDDSLVREYARRMNLFDEKLSKLNPSYRNEKRLEKLNAAKGLTDKFEIGRNLRVTSEKLMRQKEGLRVLMNSFEYESPAQREKNDVLFETIYDNLANNLQIVGVLESKYSQDELFKSKVIDTDDYKIFSDYRNPYFIDFNSSKAHEKTLKSFLSSAKADVRSLQNSIEHDKETRGIPFKLNESYDEYLNYKKILTDVENKVEKARSYKNSPQVREAMRLAKAEGYDTLSESQKKLIREAYPFVGQW